MRCKKTTCFAYDMNWSNNCSALHEVSGCNFFKTKGQLYEEITELIEKGKPQYKPSVTRQDQRRLKALLQGRGNERDGMDQTE